MISCIINASLLYRELRITIDPLNLMHTSQILSIHIVTLCVGVK